MDKFEVHEMKKIRLIMKNWFERLLKQSLMRMKPKIIIDKSKDKMINDIWRLFNTGQEKED